MVMRSPRLLALSCSLLFGAATAAAAQSSPPPDSPPPLTDAADSFVPLSADQDRELTTWLTEMEKWQRYDAKWSNRPARDGLGRIVKRQQRPEVPAWLDAHCAAARAARVLELEARTKTACRLLDDPRAAIDTVPTPAQAARLDAEKPPKYSSFLTRVHLDGLWTTASTGGRFYGLIGSHVSLVDVGRLQVFGPPGVLLLSVPDTDGSRRITLGYTWGLSLRLTDVRVFGPTKDMTLFLNLSKVWVASGGENHGSSRGYDIMGFSIAPRKKR
jgi:hypothetical protein